MKEEPAETQSHKSFVAFEGLRWRGELMSRYQLQDWTPQHSGMDRRKQQQRTERTHFLQHPACPTPSVCFSSNPIPNTEPPVPVPSEPTAGQSRVQCL